MWDVWPPDVTFNCPPPYSTVDALAPGMLKGLPIGKMQDIVRLVTFRGTPTFFEARGRGATLGGPV